MKDRICEKEISLDMESYALFFEYEDRYLDLCCDRKLHHKGKHRDNVLGIQWDDSLHHDVELVKEYYEN